MMNQDNEQFELANREVQIEFLEQMQKNVSYDVIKSKRNSYWYVSLRKIPLISGYLDKMDKTGDAVIKIGEHADFLHLSHLSEATEHGFHFGEVALSIFDFLRIPFIYFCAYLLKEKIPFHLNNNARWIYSALLLGLTICSLVIPVIAHALAFVGAILGLSVSSFLLIKILWSRAQLGKQNRKIKRELKIEEGEMSRIQQDAALLARLLHQCDNKDQLASIYLEIAILSERYEAKKTHIETLKNKELRVKQKIAGLHVFSVFKRCMSVLLASISVEGLVVALFIPYVGVGMLAVAAITGGLFILAQITTLFVSFIVKLTQVVFASVSDKKEKVPADKEEREFSADTPPEQSQQASSLITSIESVEKESVHESTSDVLHGLEDHHLKSASKVLSENRERVPRGNTDALFKVKDAEMSVAKSLNNKREEGESKSEPGIEP